MVTLTDPYCFGPVLGPLDDYYIAEGSHLRLFDKLGAHPMTLEGVEGAHFAVWAPNARRVASSATSTTGTAAAIRCGCASRPASGKCSFPIGPGALYKYEIVGPDGVRLPLKADPFARQSELRPATASVVADPTPFAWTDQAASRSGRRPIGGATPMSIYEVHLGSWQRADDGSFMSYEQLAEQLVPYVADMGFTHIELLPITEHPFDPSWGYQPTGLFAPTAASATRPGSPASSTPAIAAGLGVILDWVPAHFPTDAHGLAQFDGTALYEHADPRRASTRTGTPRSTISAGARWRPSSSTARSSGSSAFTSTACASMRSPRCSISTIRARPANGCPTSTAATRTSRRSSSCSKTNKEVYGHHPGTMTIAEESTAWPGVSTPVYAGGLGFGFKWNMGFMHDTLQYLSRDAIHRKHHHNDMTFGLLYAFSENFVLPLATTRSCTARARCSRKMPGDDWQKFATLRAYYAFMWGYPGKKLLFMGQGVRPARGMERGQGARLVAARLPACTRACGAGPRPQRRLSRAAGAACPRLRARGLRMADRRQRSRQLGFSPGCARRRERPGGGDFQLHAGAARRLPCRRCRWPGSGASGSIPMPGLWRLRQRQSGAR